MLRLLLPVLALFLPGCFAPGDHLSFPAAPITSSASGRHYDLDGNHKADFALLADHGRLDVLEYDDDQDGTPDRRYWLSDSPSESVPHLILLFDSIPFQAVADRFADSAWTWFDPPVKVIPPFPTMSPVIFSRMIGGPPQYGAINQYYDRYAGGGVNRLFERATGNPNAWERRLHYRLDYWENGLAFLDPQRWLRVDLARAKKAFDSSPDRVTIVYLASTACMLSKHGRSGLDQCLDGLEQLCMQVLYERRGAVKISMVADHGHNLIPGTRIDLASMVKGAGFRPADRLRAPRDVVIEQDGLVNYAGLYTTAPAEISRSLLTHKEVQLAMYMAAENVIVQDSAGRSQVSRRAGKFKYEPLEADVFGYAAVLTQLQSTGKLDPDGYAEADDWFDATVDHRWPDAPRRVWDAFHGVVVHTPDVMLTTVPGYSFGLPSFDLFIDMASTHGGLDQIDSATALLTMTGRAPRPMRTEDVLRTIEPTYDPSVLRR